MALRRHRAMASGETPMPRGNGTPTSSSHDTLAVEDDDALAIEIVVFSEVCLWLHVSVTLSSLLQIVECGGVEERGAIDYISRRGFFVVVVAVDCVGRQVRGRRSFHGIQSIPLTTVPFAGWQI